LLSPGSFRNRIQWFGETPSNLRGYPLQIPDLTPDANRHPPGGNRFVQLLYEHDLSTHGLGLTPVFFVPSRKKVAGVIYRPVMV
jgi:hypothetical protein